jgi:4-aminobutyrate aminotransferase/(S)-3-amino-2-methylpropionate transaminase
MVGIELLEDRVLRRPAAGLARKLAECCHQNGLIVLSCGIYDNVIRILVPLTASDEIVDEGLDILERSLEEVTDGEKNRSAG